MATSVRAVQGIWHRKKVLPQTLPIELSLLFLEIRQKKIWSALNNQSCKRPFFDLLRHRKFQKLTSSLLVTHHMQQVIVCVPKLYDI